MSSCRDRSKMPPFPVEKTGTQDARKGRRYARKKKEKSKKQKEGAGGTPALQRGARQKCAKGSAVEKLKTEKNGSEDPPLQKKEKERGRTALPLAQGKKSRPYTTQDRKKTPAGRPYRASRRYQR